MSEAESLLLVLDEWAVDRIVRAARDHADPAAVIAAAPGVIRNQLMLRCLLSKYAACDIADALVNEAAQALAIPTRDWSSATTH